MRWSGDSFIRSAFSHTGKLNRLIQILWENREHGIAPEELTLSGAINAEDISRAVYLQIVSEQGNLIRLDDRVEEFLGEMLAGIDASEAGRYSEALNEAKRQTQAHAQASDDETKEALSNGVRKIMRQIRSRLERGIDGLRENVDLDYRASANLELKIVRLQHHKETAERINTSLGGWADFLQNNHFFRATTDREIQQHWKTFGVLSDRVRQGLLEICGTIQRYLNHALRDYRRVRKLIHLNALINRHEHMTRTNIEQVADVCDGPQFAGSGSITTAFYPAVIDLEPSVLRDALAGRLDAKHGRNRERSIRLNPRRAEEASRQIDWDLVREGFLIQEQDLFRFLRDKLKVNGEPVTETEVITGFITIIQREPSLWRQHRDFVDENGWRFALVQVGGRATL